MTETEDVQLDVVVLDRGDDTNCTINLEGATLTSWRVINKEYLFVSKQTFYDHQTPIRGAIPLVFPHYGPWKYGPKHGFARIVRWQVEKAPEKLKNDDIETVLVLSDDEYTHSLWAHHFRIEYKVTLGNKWLKTEIKVTNCNRFTKFTFDWLFHTYIKVPDIRQCQIIGLKDTQYFNLQPRIPGPDAPIRQEQDKPIEDEHEVIIINDKIERAYKNIHHELKLTNAVLGRTIQIRKENLPDTIIWNPWMEEAEEISDFGNEEYLNMVCIKNGKIGKCQELGPGEEFEASQTLEIEGEVFMM